MKIMIEIIKWCISIPTYGILGFLTLGAVVWFWKYYDSVFGKNYFFRLKNISSSEFEIAKKKKCLDQEKIALQTQEDLLKKIKNDTQNVKNQLVEEKNILITAKQEFFEEIDFSNKTINHEDVLAYVSNDILTFSSQDKFLKQLKPYRSFLDKSSNITPLDVDHLKKILDTTVMNSSNHDYVITNFFIRLEEGYNPVLTVWELYKLYDNGVS